MADDDAVAEQQPVCKVFDAEDGFTSFVQALLAVLALASLYLKRQQETPKRKFWTWAMDVSKQAFGACYAHVLNMAIASILADNTRGDFELEDECAWYAINYVIDCTLGLVISIAGLKLLDYIAKERDWVSLKHSGVYHGKEGILHWINQLLAWIIILTVTKVIVCVVMWLASNWLAIIGAFLFEPFQANIRFELLFVMIFFPGLMNIIYFWITDSYLKAAGHHKHAHEGMDDSEVEMGIPMSHTHSFDIIDTGGLVREGLILGNAACAVPNHPGSVRESGVYDPKSEQLLTRKAYEEMYGPHEGGASSRQLGAGTAGQQQRPGSATGVSDITAPSDFEREKNESGGYVNPEIPVSSKNEDARKAELPSDKGTFV